MYNSARASKIGRSQKDCKATIIKGIKYAKLFNDSKLNLAKIILSNTTSANNHSTLFNAPNTILPIPSPNGRVIPGALNFNQASIKLIAQTNPIQIKVAAKA